MMLQRAKPKYTSRHLSLFNINNRNEVGGFVGCQGYVCVHWVFRRTILQEFRVTSSNSSMVPYPILSTPTIYQIAKLSPFLCRLSSCF